MEVISAVPEVVAGGVREEPPQQQQWEFGPCPMKVHGNCVWQGKHEEICDHLITVHVSEVEVVLLDEKKAYIWEGYRGLCEKGGFKRVLLQVDGKLFLFTAEAVGPVTRVQTNFLGDPKLADKFSCEVTIQNDPDKTFFANLKMACVWNADRNTVVSEEYAIPVFSSVLKKYCVGNDLLFHLRVIDV